MAYASISNVSVLAAKRTFGATSIPNSSQVAEFLDNTSSELDSILSGDGYQVPVPTTASIALLALRRLTALGAWVQVEHSAQVSVDLDRAVKAWEQAKTDLIRGRVGLVDAPRLAGQNFARAQSAATPFFTRDMVL
jgi:hypothetical protein